MCSCKDEELRLNRIPYTGSELRTDGYYYSQTNMYICDITFLYRNGIIIHATWSWDKNKPIEEIEKEMVNKYNELYKSQYEWGVFKVEDDKIEYEMFENPGLIFCGMAVYRSLGLIEKDTAFLIKQILHSHECSGTTSLFSTPDDRYHFRQFSPKPDSTNSWIK
jgi:hypothetical protein